MVASVRFFGSPLERQALLERGNLAIALDLQTWGPVITKNGSCQPPVEPSLFDIIR
jgi:hypothetical protein